MPALSHAWQQGDAGRSELPERALLDVLHCRPARHQHGLHQRAPVPWRNRSAEGSRIADRESERLFERGWWAKQSIRFAEMISEDGRRPACEASRIGVRNSDKVLLVAQDSFSLVTRRCVARWLRRTMWQRRLNNERDAECSRESVCEKGKTQELILLSSRTMNRRKELTKRGEHRVCCSSRIIRTLRNEQQRARQCTPRWRGLLAKHGDTGNVACIGAGVVVRSRSVRISNKHGVGRACDSLAI